MAGTATLTARDVWKAHGAAPVLEGISVTIAPGDVLGVVGPNGAGKSTLLRILAGLEPLDRGTVTLTGGTAGYLPQEPDRAPGESLAAFLARRTGVAAAARRLEAAAHALAAGSPGAEADYSGALEAWLDLGGADLEPRAEAVLRALGLDPGRLGVETAALSGGQAARASLAAILLSRFSVLLLDEPTNDLDFDGLERLERFVDERPGGAVIVSHDRAFLERTVTRVLELDEVAHTAAEYGGGWEGYQQLRADAARHAQERFDTYATQRDQLQERARRQRQWAETGVRNAKQKGARSRQDGGSLVFGVASLVCGIAGSLGLLLAARSSSRRRAPPRCWSARSRSSTGAAPAAAAGPRPRSSASRPAPRSAASSPRPSTGARSSSSRYPSRSLPPPPRGGPRCRPAEPARERISWPVGPAVALALLSAALVGVLFLLVLMLVTGWSVSPLGAAAAVSVLPVAALAASRVGGPPRVRAAAGPCSWVGACSRWRRSRTRRRGGPWCPS